MKAQHYEIPEQVMEVTSAFIGKGGKFTHADLVRIASLNGIGFPYYQSVFATAFIDREKKAGRIVKEGAGWRKSPDVAEGIMAERKK